MEGNSNLMFLRPADNRAVSLLRLDAEQIPKFVTDLHLLGVMHSDEGRGDKSFEISLRQIQQQVLPKGFPRTTLWAYGDPNQPKSFHHPAQTIEVTQGRKTNVIWRNELVKDPEKCRVYPNSDACNYLLHVLQDSSGVPIVDQNLHWAAPHQKCKDGERRTDCQTGSNEPYFGPIPTSVHVHGAHTESRDDGYPESWFLPKSNNIPTDYATTGSYFRSRFLPTNGTADSSTNTFSSVLEEDRFYQPAADSASGEGYAVFRFTNDQRTTSLWYHDHALGITRLNVYAASGGFWLIRDYQGRETFLATIDAKGNEQRLPSPPPKFGEDPNRDPEVKGKVREIGLVIQDVSFYKNGRLFYPASRLSMDYPQCSKGTTFGEAHQNITFAPNSDVFPVWSPEAFFDTIVVNGKTWPKLEVAPERYRFRLLNACDSRVLNLALIIDGGDELPFFVVGSDQGLLPRVVLVRTGFATKLEPGNPEIKEERQSTSNKQALLVTPAERYDVIVDFSNLSHGTKITLINTGPDSAFQSFESPEYEPSNDETTGQVMQFVIGESLRNLSGDQSTSPYDLILEPQPKLDKPEVIRDLALKEHVSNLCVQDASANGSCGLQLIDCASGEVDADTFDNELSFGNIASFLGYDGSKGARNAITRRWMDPVELRPLVNSTEEWELWNWTPDAHPIHVHSGSFEIIGRYNIHNGEQISGPMPWEEGHKDTVAVPPKTITKIRMKFNIRGLFVWHCHVLSHEDNEMMLPFCVGDPGIDCPKTLFSAKAN
eukprot:CAMPEP_0194199876 /NCGR_PEP_ID=MMETSP0156-20130528/721_1 /TAXON_ID=33649 /ORGANISM="Thalassionema nitzschioides, Strain L26-B" /LENGTH=769 /DNA_ID=CAMNT_0038924821 /DNA_START=188 /DNA_END=2497 /DNA_ORIENTATION=+